jgi:hypothetical protein
MKKRRSDIPTRTGRVERRRFTTYCNMVIIIGKSGSRPTVTRPVSLMKATFEVFYFFTRNLNH